MDLDVSKLFTEFGWIGVVIYLLVKEFVPAIRKHYDEGSAHKWKSDDKMINHEMDMEKDRVEAWKNIGDNLGKIAAELAKNSAQISSMERIMLQLLASQSLLAERVGYTEAHAPLHNRRKDDPKLDPPPVPKPAS